MKKFLYAVLLAAISLAAGAGLYRSTLYAGTVPRSYAVAVFAYQNGQMVASAMARAGSSELECEATAKLLEQTARAAGFGSNHACFLLPEPAADVPRPETPAPSKIDT